MNCFSIPIRLLLGCLLVLTGCYRDITEFGFDGSISGTVKDAAGNTVNGTTTSNALTVQALAEGDRVAIILRVKGDGTFQNTKLTPKKHRIWVTGPVTMTGDTLRVDFATEKVVQKDFVVTPFFSVATPTVSGSPTSGSLAVTYAITANSSRTAGTRQVYCSTNPYPDASIGTGPFFDTKTVALTANTGTATIAGLAPKTKYYIRVGAQATGVAGFNYSNQITVTTP
jgi:hypothetical protein